MDKPSDLSQFTAPAPADGMPDDPRPCTHTELSEAYDALRTVASARIAEAERVARVATAGLDQRTAGEMEWKQRAEQADAARVRQANANYREENRLAVERAAQAEQRAAQLQAALIELRSAENHYRILHDTSCGDELNEAAERLYNAQEEADAIAAAKGE